MMVYPNKVWDLNWGGYTAFGWGSEDADWVALPKPGRVVLFPGNINHCGIAPTKIHEGYGRFSMAYQDANDNAPVMDPSLLRKSESQKVIKQVSYEEGKKTKKTPRTQLNLVQRMFMNIKNLYRRIVRKYMIWKKMRELKKADPFIYEE